ncbi:MAG TPA: glycosyltransferase [Streptosporangiaceae bacterium]|nr:glycosyltransferase [Streptosporangiaceae bacterium]
MRPDRSSNPEIPLVVWIAGQSWDAVPGTDRPIVTAIGSSIRFLWVDPPVSPAREGLREILTGRALRPTLAQATETVTRLTPRALPALSKPVIRTTTRHLLRWQIRWALRQLGEHPEAVVATHLDGPLGNWGTGVTSVFYGTDDYVAGAGLMGLSIRRQVRQERRVLGTADKVVGVSVALIDRWTRLGAKPTLIPNGCWPVDASRKPAAVPLPELPKPVVGLVGQLSERIDLAVLEAIADAGYSLLIVGPVDPRFDTDGFRALTARPGVHYTGLVPPAEVENYLAVMHIGITPYRDSPFNRSSFPMKTLEYLAAGIPCVAADLPGAHWVQADLDREHPPDVTKKVLRLAASPAEFVEAIRGIAGEPASPAYDERHAKDEPDPAADIYTAFGARHSWQSRAEEFTRLLALRGDGQDKASHPAEFADHSSPADLR